MAYENLRDRFERISAIGEASGVLGWDMQTMMPPGGADARSRQLAALAMIRHDLFTDPRVGDWLDAAEEQEAAALSPWDRANLAEMRREWVHATAVPSRLVDELSRAGTACFMAWQTARPANDWAAFRPLLERVVALSLEVAAAKGDALGVDPYDAMIDAFEPGMRAATIDAIFAPLRDELPTLLASVEEAQAREPAPVRPEGPFEIAAQERLARQLMQVVGFDFGHGRLDVSHHPFCGGVPDDVRITTRYRPDDFASALMGVLHETGHAMYERQLPLEWRGQPVGAARGMGMHESQSLLIEMQACRSPEFIRFATPLMAEAFAGEGPAWTPENMVRLYSRVHRGFIRVDADEVSYPLHVILRFDIERRIFSGDLVVADLPDAWNDSMQSLLGIRPATNADGCMQDVHWTDGAFGYFPSYTLGAIAAAQLFAAACEAHPTIPAGLQAGDFGTLLSWLRKNVHERASSASTDSILAAATGRGFDAGAFLDHLRRRYLKGT